MRNTYKILVSKPKGKKRPIGRPRHRQKDNTTIELNRRHGLDWFGLC